MIDLISTYREKTKNVVANLTIRNMQAGKKIFSKSFSSQDKDTRKMFTAIFLSLYFLCAVVTIVLTPPMQSPDAESHYVHALYLSEGHLAIKVGDGVGQYVPADTSQFMSNFSSIPFAVKWTNTKVTLQNYSSSMNSVVGAQTQFIPDSSASYPPFLYIPAAIGIDIAQIFSSKLITGYYFAEIANLLVFLAFIGWSLFYLPRRFRKIFTLFLFFPMVISLASSVNPDGILIGISTVFSVSIIIKISTEDDKSFFDNKYSHYEFNKFKLTFSDLDLIAFVSLFFMCLQKPTYIPLVFLINLKECQQKCFKKYLVNVLFQSLLIFGSWFVWMKLFSKVSLAATYSKQANYLFDHPFKFFSIFYNTVIQQSFGIWRMMTGILGWLDCFLPGWFYHFVDFVFIILLFSIARFYKKFYISYIIFTFSIIMSAFLICLSMYLGWTTTAASTVVGLQGRYFLPLLPLFLMLTSMHQPKKYIGFTKLSRSIQFESMFVLACATLTTASISIALLSRYWIS